MYFMNIVYDIKTDSVTKEASSLVGVYTFYKIINNTCALYARHPQMPVIHLLATMFAGSVTLAGLRVLSIYLNAAR